MNRWGCIRCKAKFATDAEILRHRAESPQCWAGCEKLNLGGGWYRPACSPIATLLSALGLPDQTTEGRE